MTGRERRLVILLRVLAGLFLLAALAYQVGPLLPLVQASFRELPFVSNSVVKVILLGLCCLYAAGDLERRRGLITIVIAAHGISVAAMLLFLAFGPVERPVHIGGHTTTVRTVLWGAIVLDALLASLLGGFAFSAKPAAAARGAHPDAEPTSDGNSGDAVVTARRAPLRRRMPPLTPTPAERRMRVLLVGFGALFILAAIAYEIAPFLPGPLGEFARELPFVSNSVVKVTTLAMLCFYAARDLQRNLEVAGIVVAAHFVSLLALGLFLLLVATGVLPSASTELVIAERPLDTTHVLLIAIALDGAIAAGFLWSYLAAWKSRFGLEFFRPMEYRALTALADVLVVGADEQVPPGDVAANVENYVKRMRARRRIFYRLCLFVMYLHPLTRLKAPLPELAYDNRREHLKVYFQKRRPGRHWWLRPSKILIRVCQQLTYVGYYNDPDSFASVGYVRFSQRPRYQNLPIPAPLPHPLKVEAPADIDGPEVETDICIIGSGAGGAILAYNLVKGGRDVLLLERGRYVEPRTFTEDEVDMIGRLYEDGVLQQTEDFRFTVLQGSCVGGSTVVNNAVCFAPPERVLARWNDPRFHDAGLDLSALDESVQELKRWLPVIRQDPATPGATRKLNPSWPHFVDGARQLGVSPNGLEVNVVKANLRNCFGCGYCNIGCRFGKKLSMLDTALPRAQAEFPGRLRILAECEATSIRTLTGSPHRAVAMRARLSDGRAVTVRARTYVVAAGAIASSYLLLRSGLGRGLPVGRGLAFNMGAALTAEFPEAMDAYDGLQISHYGDPRDGFVFETWWNPPVAQALNMPGWFEDHFENMLAYRRLMAVGVLVGTAGNARVTQWPVVGSAIRYVPMPRDLATLAEALKLLGRILFADGARRVMLNTWGYDVFHHPHELARLDRIVMDPAYVTLGSGHPQGGNALSRDPGRGVVGSDFRVHGYENLYVCDASVFPSSLTVNPQLTVMALAHYAAQRIAHAAA